MSPRPWFPDLYKGNSTHYTDRMNSSFMSLEPSGRHSAIAQSMLARIAIILCVLGFVFLFVCLFCYYQLKLRRHQKWPLCFVLSRLVPEPFVVSARSSLGKGRQSTMYFYHHYLNIIINNNNSYHLLTITIY